MLLRCARVGCPWPRRYDAHKVTPKYAFGHGLSYTAFDYSALSVSGLNVTFTVKNTGTAAGAEIPQMYLGFPDSAGEPPKVARLPPAIVPTVCRVPCAACTRRAHVLLRCARVGCPWPHKGPPRL